MDGPLALSISKGPLRNRDTDRSLIFHSLASGTENAVQLRVLNNSTVWENNQQALPDEFRVIGRRGSQAGGKYACCVRCFSLNCKLGIFAAQAMDKNGNLFFVMLNPLSLVCWNSQTPYNVDNIKIVYRNDAALQFASGAKIVKNLSGDEELWIVTNRLQVWNYFIESI